MRYKKINVELIVVADEAEVVVAEFNAALDRLDERHPLFGGGIETVAFEHPGTRKRSALAHAMAAGETVALLSGLHVRAWLLPSAQSFDVERRLPPRHESTNRRLSDLTSQAVSLYMPLKTQVGNCRVGVS
jgi:hypothetical protein